MSFKLPKLPLPKDGIKGFISAETLSYHYGKHHQTYITKLNQNLAKPEHKNWQNKCLHDIVRDCKAAPIFNNAAQHWNHTFYWHCITDRRGLQPQGKLKEAIDRRWGSAQKFYGEFATRAANNFGAGWTWLVRKGDGSVQIVDTSNAGNPLTEGLHPLLTVDVWEHAYYVDYRNARPKYLEDFGNFINWGYACQNYNVDKIQMDL